MQSNPLVTQAIGLVRAGQAVEARRILLQVVKDEPQNEAAWLWLVQSLPNDAQRIAALEQCLRQIPGSEKARLGLDRLRSQSSQGSQNEPPILPPAAPPVFFISPEPGRGQPPVADLPPVPRFNFDEKPASSSPAQPFGEKKPFNPSTPLPQVKKVGSFKPFQPFQTQAGTDTFDEENDLGLHVSEKPSAPKPAEVKPIVTPAPEKAPEPSPFLEEDSEPLTPISVENLDLLRKTTRNNGWFLRLLKRFARTILIVLISSAVYIGGWYAWQVFGGRVTEYVFIQVHLLPSPTPTLSGEPTLTPTPTSTLTVTPSLTATMTPVPPTVTPSPTIIPRPPVTLGKLLFASSQTGSSAAPLAPMVLWSVGPDGLKPFQVIASTSNVIQNPTWSLDGLKVAYAAGPADGSKSDIYTANAGGSGLIRLTSDGAGNSHPSWSPDGKWLTFSSKRDGNSEIYVMNASGGKLLRLTNSSADDNSPAWSPDGGEIVFVSNRSMAYELYTLKIAQPVPTATATATKTPAKVTPQPGLPTVADVTRLTFDSKIAANPTWSPDGKKIAFSSDRSGNREIYVLTLSSQRQQRLTSSPGEDDYPAWSPDGTWLAFTSNRDTKDRQSVYLMLADGSGVYRFDQSAGSEYAPSWAPNSKK